MLAATLRTYAANLYDEYTGFVKLKRFVRQLIDSPYQSWNLPPLGSQIGQNGLFGAGGKMGMRLGANLKNMGA